MVLLATATRLLVGCGPSVTNASFLTPRVTKDAFLAPLEIACPAQA
jgi:hypothetical protein